MNPNDRLLTAVNVLTAYVLAPLAMLSVVLAWSGLVQLVLTLLMAAAAFALQPMTRRARRRR